MDLESTEQKNISTDIEEFVAMGHSPVIQNLTSCQRHLRLVLIYC